MTRCPACANLISPVFPMHACLASGAVRYSVERVSPAEDDEAGNRRDTIAWGADRERVSALLGSAVDPENFRVRQWLGAASFEDVDVGEEMWGDEWLDRLAPPQ